MMHLINRIIMAGVLFGIAGFTAMQAETLRAVIPFAFEANGKMLPAGQYELSVDRFTSRAKLTPVNGTPVFLAAYRADWKGYLDEAALAFYRYGDMHYLRAWKTAGTVEGFQAPPSKAEKAAARVAAREVAMVLVRPQ